MPPGSIFYHKETGQRLDALELSGDTDADLVSRNSRKFYLLGAMASQGFAPGIDEASTLLLERRVDNLDPGEIEQIVEESPLDMHWHGEEVSLNG